MKKCMYCLDRRYLFIGFQGICYSRELFGLATLHLNPLPEFGKSTNYEFCLKAELSLFIGAESARCFFSFP